MEVRGRTVFMLHIQSRNVCLLEIGLPMCVLVYYINTKLFYLGTRRLE